MTARLHALVIRTPDPARLSAFWDGLLADPHGNEFCVIEAGNNWLAGAGFFGELAADGIREVGVFWAAALDWPLVWDEDGETAISPPEGGFKIAWGGEPLNEYAGRHRLVLELVADDLDAEVERLVGLGRLWSSGGRTGWSWRIRVGTSSASSARRDRG